LFFLFLPGPLFFKFLVGTNFDFEFSLGPFLLNSFIIFKAYLGNLVSANDIAEIIDQFQLSDANQGKNI